MQPLLAGLVLLGGLLGLLLWLGAAGNLLRSRAARARVRDPLEVQVIRRAEGRAPAHRSWTSWLRARAAAL